VGAQVDRVRLCNLLETLDGNVMFLRNLLNTEVGRLLREIRLALEDMRTSELRYPGPAQGSVQHVLESLRSGRLRVADVVLGLESFVEDLESTLTSSEELVGSLKKELGCEE
jgi:hypothetical protein